MSVPTVMIGDVVASRGAAERGRLHDLLTHALGEVNRTWGSDLRITVGDEYQGTVPSLGAATRITLDLRLALLPDYDVRHGIGVGDTEVLDPRAGIEDGPGWWAARAAIEEAERRSARSGTRAARTAVNRSTHGVDPGAGVEAAVDAALLARDELLARLDGRSLAVLRALLAGHTQQRIAAELGVSPSAISQRIRHDGLAVIVAVTAGLERIGAAEVD